MDNFHAKFDDPLSSQTCFQIASPELQKLSEFKCAMSRQEPSSELPPSELSLYNESEEVSYASGNQDQAEKNFAIDKESKKKLSALKGRQLRLLARLNTFEDQRLLSTGAISAGKTEQNARSSRKDGSVCSSVHAVKDLTTQAKTTSSVYGANSKSDSASLQSDNGSRDTEARLSASNGTLVILANRLSRGGK